MTRVISRKPEQCRLVDLKKKNEGWYTLSKSLHMIKSKNSMNASLLQEITVYQEVNKLAIATQTQIRYDLFLPCLVL